MRFIGDYKIYHDNLLVPINTKYKIIIFQYNITNSQIHRTWFYVASDFASIDCLKHPLIMPLFIILCFPKKYQFNTISSPNYFSKFVGMLIFKIELVKH